MIIYWEYNPGKDANPPPVKGKSAVVRIDPQNKHTLAFALQEMTVPSHSLLTLPNGTVVYLNTTEGKVIHYDPRANQILTSTKVTDGFLRGVTYLGNDTLALGSKQEVLFYDMNERKIITKMKIISDPNEAVYDIKILPGHYSLPPDSMEEHFQMTTGFKSGDIILEGRTYTRA